MDHDEKDKNCESEDYESNMDILNVKMNYNGNECMTYNKNKIFFLNPSIVDLDLTVSILLGWGKVGAKLGQSCQKCQQCKKKCPYQI